MRKMRWHARDDRHAEEALEGEGAEKCGVQQCVCGRGRPPAAHTVTTQPAQYIYIYINHTDL
jgi:hypothetical protein